MYSHKSFKVSIYIIFLPIPAAFCSRFIDTTVFPLPGTPLKNIGYLLSIALLCIRVKFAQLVNKIEILACGYVLLFKCYIINI